MKRVNLSKLCVLVIVALCACLMLTACANGDEPVAAPAVSNEPSAAPEASEKPEVSAKPEASAKPEVSAKPSAAPEPSDKPSAAPEPSDEPSAAPEASAKPESKPEVSEKPVITVGDVVGGDVKVEQAEGAVNVKLTPDFGYTWNEKAVLYVDGTAITGITWTVDDSVNGYTTASFDEPEGSVTVTAEFAEADASSADSTDVDFSYVSSSGSGTEDDPYVFLAKYDEAGNKFAWKTLQSLISGKNEQNVDKYVGKCVAIYTTKDNLGASDVVWRMDITEYLAKDFVTKRPYFLGQTLAAEADSGNVTLDMCLRSAIGCRFNYTVNVSDYFDDGDILKLDYIDGSCNDPASSHSNGTGDIQASREAMAKADASGANVPSDLGSNGGVGTKTASNVSELEAGEYQVSNGLITIKGLSFGGSFTISSAS